jgi:hypothetical protein
MPQLTYPHTRPQVTQQSRHLKSWTILGVVLIGLVAVLAILFAINWPFTKSGIIRGLERSSSMQVEIRSFRSTYFPPGCTAEDVVFRRAGARDPKPLALIHRLRIQTSYSGLLSSPKHIQMIVASGVQINLPSEGAAIKPQRESKGDSLVIEEFRAQNTVLELAGHNRTAKPLSFLIRDAIFRKVATGRTIPFSLSLHVPLPPGEVQANGSIGPWRDDNGTVRTTPVSGSCTFQHANLGVFKSLTGELSARVNFTGNLQKIEVNGNTNSPDFEVKESGHRFPLATAFAGSVDLVAGNVLLPKLSAKLGATSLIANAKIAGKPKTVELNVSEGRGKLQDLILLFSDAPRSPMTGPILFHTKVVLPPEHRPFKERVRLSGAFAVDPAQFTSNDTRAHVDQLSQRARGDKDKDPDDAEDVPSMLKGNVILENGIATFQQISLSVPGAVANMHGKYSLLSKRVDLHGNMRMEATVSQASKGAKSFFLKILDPFFKKKHAGADIPVALTGTYGDTHFSAGLKSK